MPALAEGKARRGLELTFNYVAIVLGVERWPFTDLISDTLKD